MGHPSGLSVLPDCKAGSDPATRDNPTGTGQSQSGPGKHIETGFFPILLTPLPPNKNNYAYLFQSKTTIK